MQKTEEEINAEKALKSRPDLVPGEAFLTCNFYGNQRIQANIFDIFGPQGPSKGSCGVLYRYCKNLVLPGGLHDALLLLGKVMAYGREKHGYCTWRIAGTEQATPETHWASACRHVCEYLANRDATEEGSGLPVLLHAMTQCVITMDLLLDPPQPAPAE